MFIHLAMPDEIDAEDRPLDFTILGQIAVLVAKHDPPPDVYVAKPQMAAIFHLAKTFGVEQGVHRKLLGLDLKSHEFAAPGDIVVGYPLSSTVHQGQPMVVVLLVVRNLHVADAS